MFPSGAGDARRPAQRLRSLPLIMLLALTLALGVTGTAIGGFLGHASAQTAQTPAASSNGSSGSLAGVSVADVAAKVNPAVVTISNLQSASQQGPFSNQGDQGPFGNQGNGNNGPFGNQGNQGNQSTQGSSDSSLQVVGKGSGFIFDSEGHVLTNWHVIDGAQKITVEFYDGTTADATLVGSDEVQDVAVLKLDLKSGQKLPGVATLGDSSKVRAGDAVIAIGSALGQFNNTVTDGIVGGVNRSLDEGAGQTLANLIQHDAPLSSGNSGGPLLNMQGQVIGMNVAAIPNGQLGSSGNQANGLDFAIEINSVKSIAQQLIATGKVSRPYIGIGLEQDGQTIGEVDPNTPAAEAGLQPGDVIVAVNGTKITDTNTLQTLLYQHKPGDKITLTVQHQDGSTSKVDVTLAERPSTTQ